MFCHDERSVILRQRALSTEIHHDANKAPCICTKCHVLIRTNQAVRNLLDTDGKCRPRAL
ncbi:hypothetical protein COCCADRAFT_104231 [Bipolaris zeicola 26-R-13]|uniref:Uncharacterized protein n=1 Tax=Cochliobolus carbonum (strain 26-R-13) TaxID=930089 RepID=W6XYF5_COCC2|nr:uncharacterized protein COCCADRAFT_104231 [Bipolaris zeicola 26-R-13]EUC30335.1 hypothetical protein COCCADRAFT_104231 [Bipolaris zeicola 26-R-13]